MTAGKSNVSKYKKTYNVAWSPTPPKKKKNPVLDPAEKLLTNPKNKAPASTFIKRQKRLEQLMNEI